MYVRSKDSEFSEDLPSSYESLGEDASDYEHVKELHHILDYALEASEAQRRGYVSPLAD